MGSENEFTFAAGELKKHRTSNRECLEILASKTRREFDLPDSKHGNNRYMAVGFTHSGGTLEVDVELRGKSTHIFHAMTATREHRRKYASK